MKKQKGNSLIIYILISILSFLVLLLPIMFNKFLFDWRSSQTNGEMDTWINFFGTYYGAILSGVISGSITLIGVRLTIKNQEKITKDKKYQKANFVFTELLPYINSVYNHCKTLTPTKWDASRSLLLESAKKLEQSAEEMALEARYIDINFYREVKNVQYYAGVIYEYVENWVEIQPDLVPFEFIASFYNGLAKADTRLMEIVNEIKTS